MRSRNRFTHTPHEINLSPSPHGATEKFTGKTLRTQDESDRNLEILGMSSHLPTPLSIDTMIEEPTLTPVPIIASGVTSISASNAKGGKPKKSLPRLGHMIGKRKEKPIEETERAALRMCGKLCSSGSDLKGHDQLRPPRCPNDRKIHADTKIPIDLPDLYDETHTHEIISST